MATSSKGNQIYICHFCSNEFSNRPTLLIHFSQCQIKNSTKQLHEALPQLTQIQLDLLLMVKLHPSNNPLTSTNSPSHLPINDINLQIPLSNLYSSGYLTPSNQSSFNDSYCHFDHSVLDIPQTDDDERLNSNFLNHKLSSYHIYKYSRCERELYYSRIKQARLKKQLISSTTKKSYSNDSISSIFNQRTFLINIPTKINSRQRINSNSNQLYPLLFSPNFNTLVKFPINHLLEKYFLQINLSFHLLHSIASQEFQIIVQNSDQQHEFSYTSLSFIQILRQTLDDYTKNFHHRTYKRNSFHLENPDDDDDEEQESTNELSIPPLKIRRYDDSSYEIEKRSTSSSSSGMSITQIHNGHFYEDRRRCFDTRSKKFPSRISDIQINSNSNDMDKKDIPEFSVGSPLQNDSILIDHQQYKDRTSIKPSHLGEPKPTILIKEQSNDALPKYQAVALNEGARIRIVNCSNDSNKHSSLTRNSSISNPSKKFSNSIDKLDENWTSNKPPRINTRKISSTNSKTSDISEVSPSYQAQSVLLSNDEISHAWLTHNVFYRCHACSHEEFFVVLSRECMRLHVSSKHGNMEENFKQRLSNFLNNQGRALKIFQHYLKWQQPWSEKEIDQLFQLANINNRTNGAL